jgi:UDP-GlcNAc:undecaprenyl-phosphate/decaprenyl-phosphate GlcNAc-1-phosphate transferase
MVGVQMVALFLVGGYRGVWRYFGLMDGVTFARGVLFGTLAGVSAVVYIYRFESYSRGVFAIYAALLVLLLVGSRASFRLISEFAHRRAQNGQRLVIYGAGDGSAGVLREFMKLGGGCRMLGFIDDDPGLARARVQGYPVLGDYKSLVSLVTNGAVDSVVITTSVIDVDRLEELRALCTANQVSLARMHIALDRLVIAS